MCANAVPRPENEKEQESKPMCRMALTTASYCEDSRRREITEIEQNNSSATAAETAETSAKLLGDEEFLLIFTMFIDRREQGV